MDSSTRRAISYPSLDRHDGPPDIPAYIYNLIQKLDADIDFRQGLESALPAPSYAGRVWWSTDTGNIYLDLGTGWVKLYPQGAGAGSIGTTELADGAVTTIKLADTAVTTPKITDQSVTAAKIANAAITATQIANALKPSAGAAAGTEALRALGTAAGLAAAGSHAAQHIPGAADPLRTTAYVAINIVGANVDLAAPIYGNTTWLVANGTGLLRSIAAAPYDGSVVRLVNTSGTYFSIAHGLVGGSGAIIVLRDSVAVDLYPGDAITLVYNGANWYEVSRDLARLLGYAELGSTAVPSTSSFATILSIASKTWGGNTPIRASMFAALAEVDGSAVGQQITWQFSLGGGLVDGFTTDVQASVTNAGYGTIYIVSRKLSPAAGASVISIGAKISSGSGAIISGSGFAPPWFSVERMDT